MKPLDEMLPEERDPQYAELITFLQQAGSKPVSVTADRQAQILARVRERLRIPDADEGVVSRDNIDIIAPLGVPSLREVPRQHRLSRLVMLIAAVLVLGALVVTNLLIFQARTPSTGTQPTLAPPISPLGKPVTVHTQVNGLEATMQVTSGPYFLGEMLKVEVAVTNHSHDTLWQQPYVEKACAPSFFPETFLVTMTGGKPSDTNIQHNMVDLGSRCQSIGTFSQFLPNHTVSLPNYIVLTNSGRITLTAKIVLAKVVLGQNAYYRIFPNSNPLAGHWPSLQISVQAGIPSDRLITGQQRGTQVTIDAPLARSQLFYAYTLICYATSEWSSGGPPKALTLQQPQCETYMYKNHPNSFVRWTYAVGAPGYALFSGSIHR